MTKQPKTAPQLIWEAAGRPEAKWPHEAADGYCGTCATPISRGVPCESINNKTFAEHAEFFKYGKLVCEACGWLYSYPKEAHRNLLAVGDALYWPMIAADSATPERPSWLALLREVAHLRADLPLAGVLTTDPKPRKWPRTQLATVGAFGLYIHAPDYDFSSYVSLDLGGALKLAAPIGRALSLGFTKRSCHIGLKRDYKRYIKHAKEASEIDRELATHLGTPELMTAVLIAGKDT